MLLCHLGNFNNILDAFAEWAYCAYARRKACLTTREGPKAFYLTARLLGDRKHGLTIQLNMPFLNHSTIYCYLRVWCVTSCILICNCRKNTGVVQAPNALYRVPEFKSYSINIVLWAPVRPLEKRTSKGKSDLRLMQSLLECTYYLGRNSSHTMIRGEIMWILQFPNISAAYWCRAS